MPRIDLTAIPASNATGDPAPCDAAMTGRFWQRLAPAGGLTALGASRVVLKPGGARGVMQGREQACSMDANPAPIGRGTSNRSNSATQ